MKKNYVLSVALLLFVALIASFALLPAQHADAAPAAAVTPVSFSGTGADNQKVTFFAGNITADTRTCFDLSAYSKIDLQWVIDQGTVNTTTIKLQWSNDYNPASAVGNYEDMVTVATANAADTHSGQQYLLAGQYNCIFADVTNSNALGLTIKGVAKK